MLGASFCKGEEGSADACFSSVVGFASFTHGGLLLMGSGLASPFGGNSVGIEFVGCEGNGLTRGSTLSFDACTGRVSGAVGVSWGVVGV